MAERQGDLLDLCGEEEIQSWISESRHHTKDPRAGLDLVNAADVRPETVDWLWNLRIPRGKLTDMAGDPGVGKSTVTCSIAAMVSTGSDLPLDTESRLPSRVLLVSAEDGIADTIVPRLMAAGANLSMIDIIKGMLGDESLLLDLSVNSHIARLELVIQRLGPSLVVIDPLVAYLGSTNSYNDSRVRNVLAPLARIAETHRTAVLTVRHLRKNSSEKAIYRAGGSIGFTAAARSQLLVGHAPSDPRSRAVLQLKSNLGPMAPAVGFTMEDNAIRWTGESGLTPDLVLAGDDRPDRARARREAKEFLLAALTAGPRPTTEVLDEARRLGISESTLKRAKSELGVQSKKDGYSGAWWLVLSGDEADWPNRVSSPLIGGSCNSWPSSNKGLQNRNMPASYSPKEANSGYWTPSPAHRA